MALQLCTEAIKWNISLEEFSSTNTTITCNNGNMIMMAKFTMNNTFPSTTLPTISFTTTAIPNFNANRIAIINQMRQRAAQHQLNIGQPNGINNLGQSPSNINNINNVNNINNTNVANTNVPSFIQNDEECNNYICEIGGVHLAYWDLYKYIRPIKELNTDIAMEQTLSHDKYGNLLTKNDLIGKALMFLDDATHGRDFKMRRNGKLPKKIHKCLNLKWTRYFLIFICLLWLFCIQFEPPSTIYDTNSKTTKYKRIIPILLIGCLLRFYSFGRKWFLKDIYYIK